MKNIYDIIMIINITHFKRWRGGRGWRVKTVLRGKKEKILNPFPWI
jgi:hypothetical protein